jgi:hypothetical protein
MRLLPGRDASKWVAGLIQPLRSRDALSPTRLAADDTVDLARKNGARQAIDCFSERFSKIGEPLVKIDQ